MMQRLRATTERVERSVARVLRSIGVIGDGLVMTNAIAWNVKPQVPQTAFCTFGTYHMRRLQERPT